MMSSKEIKKEKGRKMKSEIRGQDVKASPTSRGGWRTEGGGRKVKRMKEER
jgi:hypothetical protein